MKKLIYACALFLSLGVLVSCDKDDKKDEPSGSSRVEGNVKVDGKTINLNYGFAVYDYEDEYAEYYFFDKDMLEYGYDDDDALDVEFSALLVDYDSEYNEVFDVVIEYKCNEYRQTGYVYIYDGEEANRYVSCSDRNSNVNISCRSIPMEGVNLSNQNVIGTCNASFSVEGKVVNLNDYASYSTRGIEVKTVTDPKQIAFLKSLKKKH